MLRVLTLVVTTKIQMKRVVVTHIDVMRTMIIICFYIMHVKFTKNRWNVLVAVKCWLYCDLKAIKQNTMTYDWIVSTFGSVCSTVRASWKAASNFPSFSCAWHLLNNALGSFGKMFKATKSINIINNNIIQTKGLVAKETVALHWSQSEAWKLNFRIIY